MKRSLGILALAAFLAVPAQGQISDGALGTADYLGPSSGVVNTPFFVFDVTVGGLGLGNVDMMCVDQTRFLTTGPRFGVQFFSLGNDLPPSLAPLDYDINRLRSAAVLYTLVQEQGLQGSRAAQYASWALNGTLQERNGEPYIPSGLVGAVEGIIQDVQNAMASRDFTFADYYLMVERRGDGSYNFSNQPQITHSVPEPGTLFLLGSGILGMAYAGRRRKEDAA